MTYNEYKEAAMRTAIFPRDKEEEYLADGLAEESGEVRGKKKKAIRDDGWTGGIAFTDERKDAIVLELGDVMWYVAVTGHVNGVSISPSKNDNDYLNGLYFDPAYYNMRNIDKYMRDLSKYANVTDSMPLKDRLQMCVYYVGAIAACMDVSLEDVCKRNIEKLASRKRRDTLRGSGDNR